MSKLKEVEISEALNSLSNSNLRGAVGDVVLRDLITDYFCHGDQSDASSESESDEDSDNASTGELLDSSETLTDLQDDRESATVDDSPVVTVNVVTSVLYSSGGSGEAVCDTEDEELERVRKFTCSCNMSCYLQLSHEFILKRRLDMNELTEGKLLLLLLFFYCLSYCTIYLRCISDHPQSGMVYNCRYIFLYLSDEYFRKP